MALQFDRSIIEVSNANAANLVYDYPYGEYFARQGFFDELSRLQSAIIAGEDIVLGTGQTIDMESTGGLLALQLYIEAEEAKAEAASGLSRTGLKNEGKIWATAT